MLPYSARAIAWRTTVGVPKLSARDSYARITGAFNTLLPASRSHALIATNPFARRAFATDTAPKAQSPKKANSSNSKPPGAKRARGKTTNAIRKKATKAVAKPKKKAKKAPAKAARPKKPRVVKTEKQIARAEALKGKKVISELKKTALNPPKKLPVSLWGVLLAEFGAGKGIRSSEASVKYKNLTAAETEHYTHLANQNKATNEASLKNWLAQFSPDQIQAANNARLLLNKKRSQIKGTRRLFKLRDERHVKRFRNAFIYFAVERRATGDYKNMSLTEGNTLMAAEWKALGESEKQKYQDLSDADKVRYQQEYKRVHGHESGRLDPTRLKA
ncbi:MAG: hypothetical protein M1829_001702 [Trizodia sp. TS-e1964]|nr:MAG: hypothetical protein M1829_001702 [Trizodia sp. TS-e1964]